MISVDFQTGNLTAHGSQEEVMEYICYVMDKVSEKIAADKVKEGVTQIDVITDMVLGATQGRYELKLVELPD